MGRVAQVKRAKGGKTKLKGDESDDSDEDYLVEEDEEYVVDDEEMLFYDEEEEDEDDGGECRSNSFNSKNKLVIEDSEEEEEMSKTTRWGYNSGQVQEKLSTRAPNSRTIAQRRRVVSSDDDEPTEKLEVSEEDKEMTRATKSKHKRGCLVRKKYTNALDNRRNQHREIEDGDYNVEVNEVDDEDEKGTFHVSEEENELNEGNRSTDLSCVNQTKVHTKASNNRRNGFGEIDADYCIDDEDDEEEDEDDEEFEDEESVSLEEEFDEEELVVKKIQGTNKTSRRTLRKMSLVSRNKSKKAVRVTNKKVGKKRKRSFCSRRKLGSEDTEGCNKNKYEDDDFSNNKQAKRGRLKKELRGGTRKFTVQSDSECVDSAPSEAEFRISEEEREQVREASNICRDLTVPLRSSCSTKIQETLLFSQRKPFVRIGKKKIQETANEVVKQVCGICFSEEGKRTVRGILNCCSHYYCFTCILQWSKVETRCPLCKHRFQTISKLAKENAGIDLSDVVLQVPERNQVYQPTEEEIRGYFDPYENMMCTECHEGGDDDLMLLCDLCDSPAHTYCVGLGRAVPEGNWYCEGCRPVSLGASNNQAWNSLTGQRNLYYGLPSFHGIGDSVDGSMSAQYPHGYGNLPSPRYFSGVIQAPAPRSGTGVVTVSGRRQIHRHTQSLFSTHQLWQAEALLAISASYSHANQNHTTQMISPPITTRTPGIAAFSYSNWIEDSYDVPPPQNIQFLSARSNHFELEMALGSTFLPGDSNIHGISIPSSVSNPGLPFHLSNRTNNHLSSSTLGEGSNFFLEEQVKPLVQNYLTSLSISASFDASTVEEITRKSIHTVLAACGYQHNPNEVYPMPPQPPCTHTENPSAHGTFINDVCNSCYTNFVKEVVKTTLNLKLPAFLQIRN